MLVNPRRIAFNGARSVNVWLDRWADEHLANAEDWREALALTRDWSDYSPRNQLLLASYGATGPVAGIETWHLVPNRDGGVCAVRTGEHALPVRVPVTAPSAEPDPHLGGVRPTQAAVAGWEWRGVFCLSQLARRPDPQMLTRSVPELSDEQVRAAVEAAARRTVRGRLPAAIEPLGLLELAAQRMPRASDRTGPTGVLATQLAQLTLGRLGRDGDVPEFDPSSLRPRERWESLADVLDVERRLTAAIGRTIGTDLLAPPLPRMAIEDDRVVAAPRRNRLPRASVAQLPVGEWVEVGPYSADEWAARGEAGAGKGAYLRLTSTAYVVAIEHGERATWRLEDTRAKVGAGRLDGADAGNLPDAKAAARRTLADRYPQLRTLSPPTHERPPAGWEPAEGQPGAWQQSHHGRVTSWVLPADGQWIPLIARGPGEMAQVAGPPAATRDEAMEIATKAARRAVRDGVIATRVDFDQDVAEFATSNHYSRQGLVDRVSSRVTAAERGQLSTTRDAAVLAATLGDAGLTAATTVAVLQAENLPADQVGPLLPTLGIGPAEAIGELHQRWGLSRVAAAELVHATAAEMRSAGCRPREILTARPLDALPTLPADPDLWVLAGGTLATQEPAEQVVGFLASHAPNADCFAAGLAAAVDSPFEGLALAARRGMPASALAASSERYGLSPADTASALGAANPSLAVSVLLARCDGDPVLTTQIARSELGLRTDTVVTALTNDGTVDEVTAMRERLRTAPSLSNDRRAILAAHQPPVARAAPRPDRAPSTTEAEVGIVEPPDLTIDRQELM